MSRKKLKIQPVVLPKDEPKVETIEIEVKPRTQSHKDYIYSMLQNDITICLGPPGCGKTYLSVGMGLKKVFQEKTHEKIVISRPAVYSGDGMGFLPGNISEKMAPYLLPIYECAKEFVKPDFLTGKVGTADYNKSPVIEIVPVCYMMGRTFRNSWIIVDEAQHCSYKELYTIVSRLGENSRLIIGGDPNQIERISHLEDIINRIGHISNVGVVKMHKRDIQRHPRLGEIIQALET